MFQFDKSRFDLAREFRARPFGEHSPDLQYLLNLMRRPGNEPYYVLLKNCPADPWIIGVMMPGGRTPPRATQFVFNDVEEAEWHVFKLRWAALAGEELSIE
jgi:N,N-dimethylformamidase